MEGNRYAFQCEEIETGEIVVRAVENVRERYQSDDCRLSVEVTEDLPPIMADRKAMTTVILNILQTS